MNNLKLIRKPIQYVIGLYIMIVFIRFLFALYTSAYPIINIDEFLYYGMARSLSEGKGLLFRGQPADYCYILYSLTLVPVYLLGFSGQLLFRALQLWNIMLISLSVFPLYNIARRMLIKEKTALIATVVAVLLPDFMLGQLIMTENVIFPLFFTFINLTLRYLEKRKIKDILLIGLIGGLLFSAKPGTLIPVIVFDLTMLAVGIWKKRRGEIGYIVISVIITALISMCFFGIVSLLNGEVSILSLYHIQVADAEHLDVFFRFSGIYFLYFIIAGGIGFFIISFRNWSLFTPDKKYLFCVILLSLIITILGVSWCVNRYEYNANTAHMRYIGMYIPLIYFFALIPDEKESTSNSKLLERKNRAPLILLFITVVLAFFDVYAGVNRQSVFAENMTLSILIESFRGQLPQWIIIVFLLSLVIIWTFLLTKRENVIKKAITISLVACLLINNVSAYSLEKEDTRFDYAQQTEELINKIPDCTDYLYLYTDQMKTSFYGALDVYSNKDIHYTTLNDLFNNLYQTRGIYKPFVSQGQRGNLSILTTPDTDSFIMDETVYYMIKLSEGNTKHLTVNNETLHYVKIIDPGEPWLDAAIGNTKNKILFEGDKGILLIFNEQYLHSPLRIKIQIESTQITTMQFYSSLEVKVVQLEKGLHEYEIDFEQPKDAYNFVVESGDVKLHGFDIEQL